MKSPLVILIVMFASGLVHTSEFSEEVFVTAEFKGPFPPPNVEAEVVATVTTFPASDVTQYEEVPPTTVHVTEPDTPRDDDATNSVTVKSITDVDSETDNKVPVTERQDTQDNKIPVTERQDTQDNKIPVTERQDNQDTTTLSSIISVANEKDVRVQTKSEITTVAPEYPERSETMLSVPLEITTQNNTSVDVSSPMTFNPVAPIDSSAVANVKEKEEFADTTKFVTDANQETIDVVTTTRQPTLQVDSEQDSLKTTATDIPINSVSINATDVVTTLSTPSQEAVTVTVSQAIDETTSEIDSPVTPGPTTEITAEDDANVMPTTESNRIVCNTTKDCPTSNICVGTRGKCECIANMNDNSNITLCVQTKVMDKPVEIGTTETVVDIFQEQKTFRKWDYLSSHDQKRSVTNVLFCSKVEVVEWFESYDDQFKLYLKNSLTSLFTNKNNSNLAFEAKHILYVAPSPIREGKMLVVSIVVQNPSNKTHDDFLPFEKVLGGVLRSQIVISLRQHLRMCDVLPGSPPTIPVPLPENVSVDIVGSLTRQQIKVLVLILIVTSVGTTLIAVIAVFFTWKRTASIMFPPRVNMPYRFPRAVYRCPGHGHHLASDEQCKLGEGRVAATPERKTVATEENGSCSLMADSNVWVVPYEGFTLAPGQPNDGDGDSDTVQRKNGVTTHVEDSKV